MTRPAALSEDHRALGEAVGAFCRSRCTDEMQREPIAMFPNDFWTGLADDIGIFAMVHPSEDSAAGGVVAASIEFGAAMAPGPIAATFFAAHALPSPMSGAVIRGQMIVALGSPPLMPWAGIAEVFIEQDGDDAWLARAAGDVEPVETLGGEPWARVTLERDHPLERSAAAARLADLATAGYLVGAGRRVLDAAVDHARNRVQFGRSIGSFQAVAHPLVDASMGMEAAHRMTVVAGNAVDAAHADGPGMAAAARMSAARAAMTAAFTAHQTMGAFGYSLEGPIAHVTRRIRQLSLGADTAIDRQEHVLSVFSTDQSSLTEVAR